MVCLGATTNVCDGRTTGGVHDPKTPVALDEIVLAGIVVDGNSATIIWETGTSYPDQIVRLQFRQENSQVEEAAILFTPRDAGEVTVQVVEGQTYYVWLRPETSTQYGEWQFGIGIADGIPVNNTLVTFQDEAVTHNDEWVTFPD